MSKKVKIIISIILVIIVCIICFFTFKNLTKTEEINSDIQNDVIDKNITEENIIDENEIEPENIIDEENEVKQEEEKETPNNKLEKNSTEVVPSSSVYESDSDIGTTNKKQEAIDLVKEKWGEDSSVDFRCDSVTTNGEYIIAVLSIESATVRNYFRVNLENKTVEIDY